MYRFLLFVLAMLALLLLLTLANPATPAGPSPDPETPLAARMRPGRYMMTWGTNQYVAEFKKDGWYEARGQHGSGNWGTWRITPDDKLIVSETCCLDKVSWNEYVATLEPDTLAGRISGRYATWGVEFSLKYVGP